jgi:hypothetical protein
MSLTKVKNPASSASGRTSTSTTTAAARLPVHSPSKRRRLTPPVLDDEVEAEFPSSQELWKWTLTKDGIAPCRVRDVFAMKENRGRGSSIE